MSKSYVIQWKSTVNGRAGRGTKFFDRAEAERLAAELNREYPDIQHEALPADSPVARVGASAELPARDPTESEADETSTDPAPSFSSR